MGLRPCHECHHFISEKARTCPRCGVPHPVVSDEDTGWAGRHRGALMLALAYSWRRWRGSGLRFRN